MVDSHAIGGWDRWYNEEEEAIKEKFPKEGILVVNWKGRQWISSFKLASIVWSHADLQYD